MGTKTYNDRQIDNFVNRSLSMALAQAQARFTIYAWVSVAYLPASRCDWKCIQNNLDERRVRWNRNNFYSSVRARCDVRPNHFVCTSGCNARPSVYCEPGFRPKKAYMAAEANYEYQWMQNQSQHNLFPQLFLSFCLNLSHCKLKYRTSCN